MTDYTDHLETDEQTLVIPATTTAKIRLIKKLIAQRFFISLALTLSVFINLIFIVEYKL